MFSVRVRPLTMCRGELSVVIVRTWVSVREVGCRDREELKTPSLFPYCPMNRHVKENPDRKKSMVKNNRTIMKFSNRNDRFQMLRVKKQLKDLGYTLFNFPAATNKFKKWKSLSLLQRNMEFTNFTPSIKLYE